MIKLLYTTRNARHFTDEIERADRLISQFIENGKPGIVFPFSSDVFVLRIAQAIRAGILASNDVQIYCHQLENGIYDDSRSIRFDIKGDFIEPWVVDDLFEVAFHLRFNNYKEYPSNV